MADKPKGVTPERSGGRNRGGERRNRRETIEAMRRQQKAKERRKTMLLVALASLIGLALVALAAVPAISKSVNDPKKKAPASFGVAAAAASCDPEIADKPQGVEDHVDAGVRVDYPVSPPSNGRHDGNSLVGARPFYDTGDRPKVEQLVHTLEHGYTILWYDSTVTGDDLEALKGLAERMRVEAPTAGKFIVAPWTGEAENRPKLPEGKHVAMTHWGAQQAYRQYCGAVSGEAASAFVQKHPSSDAPEPNGV